MPPAHVAPSQKVINKLEGKAHTLVPLQHLLERMEGGGVQSPVFGGFKRVVCLFRVGGCAEEWNPNAHQGHTSRTRMVIKALF